MRAEGDDNLGERKSAKVFVVVFVFSWEGGGGEEERASTKEKVRDEFETFAWWTTCFMAGRLAEEENKEV